MDDRIEEARRVCTAAANKLCKWRSLLVGRILGTRPVTDQPTQGMRDLMDKLLLLRAENSAVVRILVEKGVASETEVLERFAAEYSLLDKDYEKAFPGFRTAENGVDIVNVELARDTMKGWPA